MPKFNLLITLSLIITFVFAGNVYPHTFAPHSRPIPKFPYTKFSQKPKVVQRITVQLPKVHDLKINKIVPSITPIPETQNPKLREIDVLRDFNMISLHGPKTIEPGCCNSGHISFGEITVPPLPLLPPIISPIADPFNDDLNIYMSLEEFYSWWRIYRGQIYR